MCHYAFAAEEERTLKSSLCPLTPAVYPWRCSRPLVPLDGDVLTVDDQLCVRVGIFAVTVLLGVCGLDVGHRERRAVGPGRVGLSGCRRAPRFGPSADPEDVQGHGSDCSGLVFRIIQRGML